AFALFVEFQDAFTQRHGDGFHAHTLPASTTFVKLHYLWKRSNIVHLWFKDGYKWKFSEGDSEWNAEIKDQKFLEKLLKDEVALHARDFLKVRVKQTQYTVGSTVKSDYEILEVLEIKQSPRQTFMI
ncbi:MAG: hypothetical protein ACREFE_09180, partial [Limisphaerales bacterium]